MRTTAAAGRSFNGNYSKVSEVELLTAYIDESYFFWIKSKSDSISFNIDGFQIKLPRVIGYRPL